MASTRQPKSGRKGLPDTARRGSAWGSGARASPTFSSASNSSRTPNVAPSPAQSGFSPHPQPNGSRHDVVQDRVLQSLTGLTGTTIVLSTKTAQRYEGVVFSTTGEGDTAGVTLKDVKEVTNLGAPLKEHLFIASTNIDTWSSGPADVKPSNGDTFRTDTDISQKKGLLRERELQAWLPGADVPNMTLGQTDDTFGAMANAGWDQFAVNEKLFGVKTNFDEDVYTTRLDRSAADFKERERKAQRLANEIMGTATNNPHILEERGHIVDDGGVNEEDKYGAVVRGSNAYIPPAARKQAAMASAPAGNVTKTDIPKMSVNGADGTNASKIQTPPSKTSTPVPVSSAAPPSGTASTTPAQPSVAPSNKPPADPLPAFRNFVVSEKQRLTQKRQALVRSEMDKKISELVKFGQSFKLNKPIPEDLVPILAKDEEKQRAIREKANEDAQSTQARSIGVPSLASATRGVPSNVKPEASRKLAAASSAAKNPNIGVAQVSSGVIQKAGVSAKVSGAAETGAKKPTISMYIQPIPPFKGGKVRQQSIAGAATSTTSGSGAASGANGSAINPPASPSTARLNANASSFRPNPKASAFTPGTNSPNTSNSNRSIASASPKPKTESAPATPNPFFGKQMKKTNIVPLKDDFNPFKHGKVNEPTQTSQLWPYTGKRYNQMFPITQHPPQPHPSHMVPQGPPPMPPPSYEEDSAAQAAARGYVYAYPPYGYPGQHMMPGMAPPGPPTAYLPGPFMQPMPYPPGMPPPAAMYSPAMGQMPPPQAYMPPPHPPGAYPPPPNGATLRPSMPPTPIPAHAHPYYHQSPQMQHAVPYPMMMPPPPNAPPHPYEGGPAPPVQMGGHA
ncbi:hypothetical protein AX17_002323 [Amanita inopinata Kibby_2008]|nr:hypothetical protein AX17_002323 [Amanita inopinata Kibby_2008]